MNLNKSLEFFNPIEITDTINIIGVGAIGSTLAENLARLGLSNIHLYDFDKVCSHNIANQMFVNSDIDKPKIDCVKAMLEAINPEISVTLHPEGWKPSTNLSGYVFMCVDSIEIRKAILSENKYNTNIKGIFDFRMGLSSAQHFAAKWSDMKMKEALFANCDFTHEEAKEQMPVSACGTTLSVVTTIRCIVSLGVSNFINFLKEQELKKMIIIDAFSFTIDAF